MTKTVTYALLLVLGAVLAANVTPAEDKKDAPPDEKAYAEAAMKAATPGEPHKLLGSLAGSWEGTVKMWMDPSKPPIESKGASTSKMILGGRYLEEKIKGSIEGQPFEGQALTAYDNVQKKYFVTWIDSMGTGIMQFTGTYDADQKTYTYTGDEIDPLTAKKSKSKLVLHVIDKDNYEEDMFKVAGDKEIKVMHIDYKRKAAK